MDKVKMRLVNAPSGSKLLGLIAGAVIAGLVLSPWLWTTNCPSHAAHVSHVQYGASDNATMAASQDLQTRYLALVKMAVTGSLTDEAGRCNGFSGCPLNTLLPYDAGLRWRGGDWPPFGHTMVGHLRLNNIETLIRDVVSHNIPGHFVELGVWRGGSCIVAKAVLNVLGQSDRKVLVFDAFEKIPGYGASTDFLAVSESAVRHNFEKYGVLDGNVEFHKGLFKDTLPAYRSTHSDAKFAILRIDGNYYDSYQDALYYLFELVQVDGYIIFDDIFTHPGAKQAWQDFVADQHIADAQVTPIDAFSGYFKKTRSSKVDRSKMKPPKDANKP